MEIVGRFNCPFSTGGSPKHRPKAACGGPGAKPPPSRGDPFYARGIQCGVFVRTGVKKILICLLNFGFSKYGSFFASDGPQTFDLWDVFF